MKGGGEIADKKRNLNTSKSAIDESKPDPNSTDQDMTDADPHGIGESSSSTDAAPPLTETAGDQVAEGTERKAEDQLLLDARDRCEQSERAMKFSSHKLLLQFFPMPEVTTEDTLASSGLKRPQDDDADVKNIRQRGRHDWKPSAVSFTEILVDKNKRRKTGRRLRA